MRNQKVSDWERKNKILVDKILKYYEEYKGEHKLDFDNNEYQAHKKMLSVSARTFKIEINAQVKELLKIR